MQSHITEKIALILKSLPQKPGVYRFLDENGTIIYIGKAKNLKKRVNSYFSKNHEPGKLRLLVNKIRDIQTTIVDSEWEALLLENSMIKQFKPRYNKMMKDDKTYPWIAVSKEDFPKLYATRTPDRFKNEIFGPYASVLYMNALLETLSKLFPIRTCNLNLSEENIKSKKFNPCIQYQIKRCAAPCVGFISKEIYQENIKKIVDIIKGNSSLVLKQLREEMMSFATQWEFEKAQAVKEKLEMLEKFKGKSVVVNPDITKLDVFSIVEDEDDAYVNFLRVMEGSVIQAYTLEITHKLDKNQEELLLLGIIEIKELFGYLFPDIVVPFIPQIIQKEFNFSVPQRGDKKKLLELSEKNAKFFMLEKHKRQELVNPARHQQRVLAALQKDIGMKELPTRIECFDNSNTQGEEPVAAMVCFIDGKPDKKEYRHFNIRTVEGPNDFASMEEVIYRRYYRLLEEKKSLPNLIIIDGGKGQLSAAYNSLQKLGIEDRVMLIGIAKRLEDIYKVGDPLPVYIDKKSESQKLIQRIRDEVHRFGITHHRGRRAKKSIASVLDQIPGIGDISKNKLLRHFKSVKFLQEASEEEIARIVNPAKAKIIKDFFRSTHL